MDVYRDANGNPCPERDFRDVPLAVMAIYLGIDKTTLWRRTVAGQYAQGIRKIGQFRYYKPAIVMDAVRQAVAP